MKIARVTTAGSQERLAISTDGQLWQLVDDEQTSWPLQVPTAGCADEEIDIDQLNFLPPIASPEKIICVGKNYEQHAREMGSEKPELPVIFNKLASCLIGQNQSIELPPISKCVDFEAELVVVIGNTARNIKRENAMDYVLGYTIGNDVSARDWQKGRPGGQWLLGKAFDTFAPLGPWLVTADEIEDPNKLDIELTLNGVSMQSACTSEMIFKIDYLIWHLSQFFTLRPGDLLFTGTPAGVGAGRTPEVYLKPGDELAVSISNIGKLTNPVVDRSSSD